MIIRLSTLLSIPAEESDTTTLNKLFYNICNDDDILYIVKSEPGSFVYNVMTLIKQALQEQSPIDFIRSKVSISSDKQYLIFDF